MRVVSDNSERDLAIKRAQDGLSWPLRDLAANLMRITRGAGKPHEVGRQMVAVFDAYEEYRAAAGHYPTAWDIQTALTLDDPAEHWRDWDWAIRDMVKGGLQMAASNLLGQGTQAAAGRHEMLEGLAVIERIRADNRRGAGPKRKGKVTLD